MKIIPPLMPHAERRKLIEAPIHLNIQPGRSWGGHPVRPFDIPVDGHRIQKARVEGDTDEPTYTAIEQHITISEED